MGMFDRIWFTCPNCGKPIEEQSKAGECLLLDYNQTGVPLKIASAILNSEVHCDGCKETFVIVAKDYFPPLDIEMKLVKK